ncbi:hypothetical protein BJ875DRAFT_335861, partial [Amylocarpus encephaloides]
HSAEELCGSASSRVPGFISKAESLFCDIDKETWHLCTDAIVRACFHLEKRQMR